MNELKHILAMMPVGSRVTRHPAPTETDRDWLVLVDPLRAADFLLFMLAEAWTQGGSDIPDESNFTPEADRFHSFTKSVDGVEENVIATTSAGFYRRFIAATSIAKRLNLMGKDDRIALFQAVLYGNQDSQTALPATREFQPAPLADDPLIPF